MSVISTKKRTSRYHSDQHHNSYGLQNWLLKKGYIVSKNPNMVDSIKYYELLQEFCESIPGFDASKIKSKQSYENYAQNNFSKFTQFVTRKFKLITL